MTRTTSSDTSTASPSSAASSSSSRAGGPGPRGHGSLKHMGSSELPDALLIDLYDTLVWGEWPGLRDTMAARIGITSAALQSAFEGTRPSRGVRTALVSNCSRSTRPVVDDLGLEREMDAVVLSFEVGAAKPDAAIYRAALDRLRSEPSDAAFVDDQSIYCDGAAALGMRTYLIQRDPSQEEPAASDGHTIIPDLAALLA